MRSHRLRAASDSGPSAIVSGAIMHWDFGNYSCWNRSNSTVTDLTGNGLNGTIDNYNTNNETHTYNSNKGGYCAVAQTGSNLGGASGISGNVTVSGNNFSGNFRGSILFGKHLSSNTTIQPYTLEFIADIGPSWNAVNNNLLSVTSESNSYSSRMYGAYYTFAGIYFGTALGYSYPKQRSSLIINDSKLKEYGFVSNQIPNNSTSNTDSATYGSSSFTYSGINQGGDTAGWEQIIVTREDSTSSTNFRMYRNGVKFAETSSQLDMDGFFNLIDPIEYWFTSVGGWGIVRGYDKAFTDLEALGQYNAQKARFGI